MSVLEELRELDPSDGALRRFGLLVGAVFLLLGALWLARGRIAPASIAGGLGGSLVVLAAIRPRLLRRPRHLWMAGALCLGVVTSSVLLTLLFFLVVTPVGLAARLAGRDFLQRRSARGAASCWIQRRPPAGGGARHERQF